MVCRQVDEMVVNRRRCENVRLWGINDVLRMRAGVGGMNESVSDSCTIDTYAGWFQRLPAFS